MWTVSVGTFQVPWTSVRIVGTRSQWSVKHLASVPKYEVLSSKPVVGTVRQLLAGILVESFVTYTSRGKVARCEYYANRDEAVHTETRCIPGYRRACRGGRGLQSGSPPTKSKKKKKIQSFCRHDDMKRFMWFSLQPKSATEIDQWLVHWNFGKVKQKHREF